MSELKPCPFCGGIANVILDRKCQRWSVGCNNDNCLGFIGLGWTYGTEQEAIEAWNTRHERTCAWKSVCDEQWWKTECGMTYECYDAAEPSNYCPNCGAKVIKNEH